MTPQLELHPKAKRLFIAYVVGILALYFLSLPIMHALVATTNMTIINTVVALLVFCSLQLLMCRHLKISIKHFLHLDNPKQQFKDALLYSICFSVLLIFIKWLAIDTLPGMAHATIFNIGNLAGQHVQTVSYKTFLFAAIYILFVPLQVFLVNAALQGPIMLLFKHRYAAALSVVISVLIFCSIHLPVNKVFAIAMLGPGTLWAILYVKHRSMIAVTISHTVIGLWALYFLGYGQVFEAMHQLIH